MKCDNGLIIRGLKKGPMPYMGGKFRGRKLIMPFFPKGLKEICSPFLGAGSLEIGLHQHGIKVFAYDHCKELCNFGIAF